FPELVPTRMGPSDPPRTTVTTVEDLLLAWAPLIHPGDYFTQFMARSLPGGGALLSITGEIWNSPPIGPHKLELFADEDWFAEPNRLRRLRRFADLFRR